jgi:hypothetical protein
MEKGVKKINDGKMYSHQVTKEYSTPYPPLQKYNHIYSDDTYARMKPVL